MNKMCKRKALIDAADLGLLHYGQVDPLLHYLEERLARHKAANARFTGGNVLYYLGGMLAIGACTLFSTLAVEKWGMPVLLDMTLVYILCTITLAMWLDSRGQGVPAGIFAALTVALVPLGVFSLQHVMGFWSDSISAAHYRDFHALIDWRWLIMELATLLAGCLMLWRFRYSFLVMPIAVTLFYMGMDIVPALFIQGDGAVFSGTGWAVRQQISMVFGLLMLVFAFVVDVRSRSGIDYAFWLYLFGLMSFWGALSSMGNGELAGKFVYLAINALLVLLGAVLERRMFTVFGGIGVAMMLGELSWHIFKDSFVFVALLTLLGFALIGAGLWWSKHEHRICARLRSLLPESMQMMLLTRG
ncbi:DUF2157 domain-containing protein [Undibacterium sp. TJN25]|uniref:DUF2157 domain-containing protein n=1 Tax=Undibacterium sp. TJN25 TaxID=3413056 RepID=UPI003BF32C0B